MSHAFEGVTQFFRLKKSLEIRRSEILNSEIFEHNFFAARARSPLADYFSIDRAIRFVRNFLVPVHPKIKTPYSHFPNNYTKQYQVVQKHTFNHPISNSRHRYVIQ